MQRHAVVSVLLCAGLLSCLATGADSQPHDTNAVEHSARDLTAENARISEVAFTGLLRISPKALNHELLSRAGDRLDRAKVAHDVSILARTGWFKTVRADIEPTGNPEEDSPNIESSVRLTFYVLESPFLSGIEFSGSRLLARQQIDKLLTEKKLAPRLGEPVNPVRLDQIRRAIEEALMELGHPHARVTLTEQISAQATVVALFTINDGPRLTVGKVSFQGDSGVPQKLLRRQVKKIKPDALLAGIRSRDVFTRQGFEDDRGTLLTYLENHGYPEARIGSATVSEYEVRSRRWWRLGRESKSVRLHVAVPVQAGPLYKFGAVELDARLTTAIGSDAKANATYGITPGHTYSAEAAQNLRRACERRLQPKRMRNDEPAFHSVEMKTIPDATTHTMHLELGLGVAPPYIVRRLEFTGIHHFPDRYFRRRIGVKEGAVFDDRVLEAGLARLARTGYFKSIKKQNIQVAADAANRTVDVRIQLEELGEQRASLVGGRGQFGSTLGIAYTLFNLFDREELLSSRIEGGPESLQLGLGFAKEGFLGSRASLALSLFNAFVRPQLAGTAKGPFFRQRSEGASADYGYVLTAQDTLTASYGLSYSDTSYSPTASAGLGSLAAGDVHAKSSRNSFGLGWTHDTGSERLVLADSVSGGWLGGSENLLRSKAEYGRIVHDPIFKPDNSWAFRTTIIGVGSYSGDMPITARWYSGDQFVRGLRDGDLGPQALFMAGSSSGTTHYSTAPAGANLSAAENAEYRARLGGGTEAVGFFDVGSGLMEPNWLGRLRPTLIDSTNGMVYASTGMELRWTLPGIGVPMRAYYAWNVLRLDRSVFLPNGSLVLLRNHLGAFGWGLGSFF
jgi:outer membrane protein assembly complex protein YaeT